MLFNRNNCYFYTFHIILFIIYWLLVTPLLFVYLKSLEFENKQNSIKITYWILALFIYVLILLLSILVRDFLCRIRDETESMRIEDEILFKMEKESNCFIYNNDVKILLNPKENDSKTIYNFCEPVKIQLNEELLRSNRIIARETRDLKLKKKPPRVQSIEISTQADMLAEKDENISPLTPREIFFHEMIQNLDTPEGSTSGGFKSHDSDSSKLMHDEDLYTNHKDLYNFIIDKNRIQSPMVYNPRYSLNVEEPVKNTLMLNVTTGQSDLCKTFLENKINLETAVNNKRSIKDYYVPASPPIQIAENLLKSQIFIQIQIEKNNDDDVFYT